MRRHRLITICILSLWVFASLLVLICGSHCTSRGTVCASLCAPTPGVLSVLPIITLLAYHTAPMQLLTHPLTPLVKVPTPPPKDLPFPV